MSPRIPHLALVCCLLLLTAGLAPRAAACLWDSDTLAMEVKGMPEIVDIIVGRFERNPSLYYEMRLQRVAAALADDPNQLEMYDDAAVASDKLGDPTAAIEWMRRKHEQMAAMDLAEDTRWTHEYRYLANLGTFHAHRWFKGGTDRENMTDLAEAERLIAAAIEHNPDAHFGREKYQLMAIQAILRPVAETEDYQKMFRAGAYPTLLDRPESLYLFVSASRAPEMMDELGFEDAVTGLTGLIVLGAAWESVDVFHTLSMVLGVDDQASLALLAKLRAQELVDDGKYPILPGLPEDVHRRTAVGVRMSMAREPEKIFGYYAAARASADQWAAHREAYMLERLQAGRHPDTDPTFWNQWDDKPAQPTPPGALTMAASSGLSLNRIAITGLVLALSVGAAAVLGIVWVMLRRSQRVAEG